MKFRSVYNIFFFKYREGSAKWLRLCLGVSALLSLNTSADSAFLPLEQLQQQASAFLMAEYQSQKADRVDIKMGALDSRLRLATCEQPLHFQLEDQSGNGGNITVQVSCRGLSRWTVLVPAQATIFRSIAVANRRMERGEVISEGDIQLASVDVSQYRQGFVVDSADIVGKELKMSLTKGDAFRASLLNAPLAIKRGESVSMEALVGSIRVVTVGTAISDGRIGQQIRVKNNQSERIVNAKVIAVGRVQNIL